MGRLTFKKELSCSNLKGARNKEDEEVLAYTNESI